MLIMSRTAHWQEDCLQSYRNDDENLYYNKYVRNWPTGRHFLKKTK